ncbi:MAG: hypothetical protein ACKO96_34480 [Flammeovirgaceae bacterium]
MLSDFSKLPPDTRVWVYQANKTLTPSEEEIVQKALQAFCVEWQAHGQPLESNFEIRDHRFVILYVNEETHAASGCSIDGSVRVMKGLQQQLNIDFFDRTQVAFLIGATIQAIPITKLRNAFTEGVLTPDSITFNTLATTKVEIEKKWRLAAENTWLVKYLPNAVSR